MLTKICIHTLDIVGKNVASTTLFQESNCGVGSQRGATWTSYDLHETSFCNYILTLYIFKAKILSHLPWSGSSHGYVYLF